jgi:hypothetical protein
MNRKLRCVITVALSLISVFAVDQYFFSDSIGYKSSIVNLFVFAMVFGFALFGKGLLPQALCRKTADGVQIDPREIRDLEKQPSDINKWALIFSIILSIVLVLGSSIDRTTTLSAVFGSWNGFIVSLFETGGFVHLFYVILVPVLRFLTDFHLSDTQTTGETTERRPPVLLSRLGILFSDKKRSIFVVWAVLFICWLPAWLAYYPGIFSYDAPWQFLEIVGEVPYHNFHPLLHTLFMEVCFRVGWVFGGNAAGLIIYSLVQMFLMSFILSYALWRLAVMRLHIVLRLVILVFFVFNPVVAVFSFVLAKDSLAGGFFVLVTVSLAEMIQDKDAFFKTPKRPILLAVFSLLLCLLRNNVMIALILFLILLLIVPAYKGYRRGLLPVFGSVILATILITGPLFTAFHINGTSKAEALSVPLQQVALATVNHGIEFSDAQREAIDEVFLPNMATDFNLRIADPVKSKLIVSEFDKDTGKYVGLWFQLLKKYPTDYINAALNLNLAYWYPDTKQPDAYSNRDYIETYIYENHGIERHSKIPWLLNLYESLVNKVEQQKIPVVGFLFNIGAPIWFVFFWMIMCRLKGRGDATVFLLPAVVIWLTFLLGPVANLRYMYPLMLASPIYLGMLLQMNANAQSRA